MTLSLIKSQSVPFELFVTGRSIGGSNIHLTVLLKFEEYKAWNWVTKSSIDWCILFAAYLKIPRNRKLSISMIKILEMPHFRHLILWLEISKNLKSSKYLPYEHFRASLFVQFRMQTFPTIIARMIAWCHVQWWTYI